MKTSQHSYPISAYKLRRSLTSKLRTGFTLIEMIATISVLAIVSAVTVPALQGVSGSSSLSVAAREFSNLLTQARSEAIARHTVMRLAVETQISPSTSASLRRSSLWEWNEEQQLFVQVTEWHEITDGLVFETTPPDYIRSAAYASADGSSIRGDFVLNPASTETQFTNPKTNSTMRVIEFLPSGSVRIPGGNTRNAIFVIAPGFSNPSGGISRPESSGAIYNWAQINVDTLTGRVRIYRP